jgi:hypothetical protein
MPGVCPSLLLERFEKFTDGRAEFSWPVCLSEAAEKHLSHVGQKQQITQDIIEE